MRLQLRIARNEHWAAGIGEVHRVTREFQREHPCPSTGLTTGACPAYRKDHVVPVACGGPTRFLTCSVKPFATRAPRTGGAEGVQVANPTCGRELNGAGFYNSSRLQDA